MRGRGNIMQQTHFGDARDGSAGHVSWRHNYVFNAGINIGDVGGGEELAHTTASQDVRMETGSEKNLGKRTTDDSVADANNEILASPATDPATALVPFAGMKSDRPPKEATVAEKVTLFEGGVEGDQDKSTTNSGTPQKECEQKEVKRSGWSSYEW